MKSYLPRIPLETGSTYWNSVQRLIPCELPATLECKFQEQEQGVSPGYIS